MWCKCVKIKKKKRNFISKAIKYINCPFVKHEI